ncbi:hypothetical protein Tco_0327959 [Tanacetum coccineum]
MLAICATDMPLVFKAPKTSSKVESVSQGTKPGAKPGHKKISTSLKQPFMSSKEVTKGGSSKAPTSSKTGNSKKRKESSSAMDSNPSQPPVFTHVDNGMHKENQQATSGPTSLGVTSEARANPHLSSGMSAFNLNEPIYLASFIIHSKSAIGNDASVVSTTEADPGKSAPSNFVPQQQGANSIARQVEEEEASNTIKLEDLAKLVSNVQCSFKDLDSPEDDPVIVVDDSDEDEEDKSQKHKLELKKNKAEAEVALFKAQPFFPNIGQLNDLLDLPSKFNELTEEVKVLKQQVHELEIELPGDLKEIPSKLEDFTKTVASVQAKLNTLDALSSLLLNVTKALKRFAQVLDSTSSKARDQSIPLVGQADTMPVEGEKNTNQATISQVFQRRAEKNAEKDMNKQQPKPTTPPATTIIPPIITTTTTRMQTPPQNPQKGSSQLEREHIKKDKGKKAMSSKDAEEMSTESDSDDETTRVPGSMVESSKKKDFKKFDFVTEDEEHVHLTEEQTVVNKYYNDKLQYDRYCDKMLNRKAKLRITNCDILTRKGPITLKVYREDDTSKIILEFKASDLHLGEWREVVKACPNKKAELGIDLDRPLSEQDPLDRLNDLPNKKRKHADDIHHFIQKIT